MVFKAKLKHEDLVYRHLDEREFIPVYLGNIALIRPYFLDVGVKTVRMLLMPWAGEQARKDLMLAMGRDLAAETSRAVTELLNCGVEHRDVLPPNVLWNPETRNVVLVDFERSEILKRVPVLQETSPNQKRKRLHIDPEASCRILPGFSSMPASASIGCPRRDDHFFYGYVFQQYVMHPFFITSLLQPAFICTLEAWPGL